MKYLFEFVFSDNIKNIYLYDDQHNDFVSSRLKSNFINNLIEISTTNNISEINTLFFKNISISFTFKNFSRFLKDKRHISLIQIYDFFDKISIVKFILEDFMYSRKIDVILPMLNANPMYYINLIKKCDSSLRNDIAFENNLFYPKNKIILSNIKNKIKTSDDGLYFVDVSKLFQKISLLRHRLPIIENKNLCELFKDHVKIYDFDDDLILNVEPTMKHYNTFGMTVVNYISVADYVITHVDKKVLVQIEIKLVEPYDCVTEQMDYDNNDCQTETLNDIEIKIICNNNREHNVKYFNTKCYFEKTSDLKHIKKLENINTREHYKPIKSHKTHANDKLLNNYFYEAEMVQCVQKNIGNNVIICFSEKLASKMSLK